MNCAWCWCSIPSSICSSSACVAGPDLSVARRAHPPSLSSPLAPHPPPTRQSRPHPPTHNPNPKPPAAGAGEDANASQFYITTAAGLDRLDGQHTVFGEVAEGWDVLDAINDAVVDGRGRPLQNIRVRHTIVLDDPTPDPRGLADLVPDASPAPEFAEEPGRLEDDWAPEEDARPAEEIERSNREKEARNRAVVLEMIGDLPEADAAPPADMLFVCKLNPVTTEEDLETIFSRFGGITSCDIIRDWKTGDSLSYAFIGFATRQACEAAYYKMNNVLIDDRRIRVDFSQSVSHLWRQFRRHGGRGTADMAGDAAQHQRQATPARQDRLELKERFRGPTAVYGSHRGGGGDYELLVEEDVRVRGSGEAGAVCGCETVGAAGRYWTLPSL